MDLYESRNAIEFKKAMKNFYDNTFTFGSGGIMKNEDSEGWITINGTQDRKSTRLNSSHQQ